MNTTKTHGDLGTMVTYISTKGQKKTAMVLGTPDSIDAGTSLPQPVGGQRHLMVFSPTGQVYPRHGVPSQADHAALVEQLGADDAPEGGYWI